MLASLQNDFSGMKSFCCCYTPKNKMKKHSLFVSIINCLTRGILLHFQQAFQFFLSFFFLKKNIFRSLKMTFRFAVIQHFEAVAQSKTGQSPQYKFLPQPVQASTQKHPMINFLTRHIMGTNFTCF